MEHREITNVPDTMAWARILGNPRKVMLLIQLSKGDLSMMKITEMLMVAEPTVSMYVKEMQALGIVVVYPVMKGKYIVHMVRLKVSSAAIDFSKLDENGGWLDVAKNSR